MRSDQRPTDRQSCQAGLATRQARRHSTLPAFRSLTTAKPSQLVWRDLELLGDGLTSPIALETALLPFFIVHASRKMLITD
jgi:hypothetical protein